MTVGRENITLLARLLSAPVTDDAFLGRLECGCIAGDKWQNAWHQYLRSARPRGISMDAGEYLFAALGNRGQGVCLFSFYAELAEYMIEAAGGSLRMRSPNNGSANSFGDLLGTLTEEERDFLFHELSIRVGPDLLPALLVAGLRRDLRRDYLARGLWVDPVHIPPLRGVLQGGIVECHLHSGSAQRIELLWPDFLEILDRKGAGNFLPPGWPVRQSTSYPQDQFERDLPLYVLALLIRRLMEYFLVGGRISVVGRAASRVGSDLTNALRFGSDMLLQARHAAILGWLGQIDYMLRAAGKSTLDENKLMVESATSFSTLWASAGGNDRAETEEAILACDLGFLFWTYVQLKGRFLRFFIEEGGLEGIEYFRDIFGRAKSLQELRLRVLEDPARLEYHLALKGRVRGVELRVSPELTEVEEVLDACLTARTFGPTRFGVIVHFLKPGMNSKSSLTTVEELCRIHGELQGLQDYLEDSRYGGRLDHFVGIDVAGSEMGLPNWLFLPAFTAFRPWWTRSFPARRPGYTFHAGEDFLHPRQGLRHVGEVLSFFPWESGDRIGHGFVLGLDLNCWREDHGLVFAPLDVQLFDLIWEWGVYAGGKIVAPPGTFPAIEQRIARLGRSVLSNYGMDGDLSVNEWWLFYEGLFCPPLLNELCIRLDWGGDVADYRKEKAQEAQGNHLVRAAIRSFLASRHETFRAEPYDSGTNPEIELARLETLQEYLVRTAAERHIVIEVCPTSNMVIRRLWRLEDHPLFRLKDRLTVVLNTDDPLTFVTTLSNEYVRVFLAMQHQEPNAGARAEVMAKLARNSRESTFLDLNAPRTRIPPSSRSSPTR